MHEYEIICIKKDGSRDYAFCRTLKDARDQAFEFMLAYKWAKIEIVYPTGK